MRNLIENAVRYGQRARVSLVREGPSTGPGWAVVRIEDDGPGIPEGEIAAMMEPFARGEASRNRETGGAGLGLTLARAIAEQHGGTITLKNRAEGGLVAELRLPLD
jgi:signal transduction histidine kinase